MSTPDPAQALTDDAHMAHALGLAARALGSAWPNPAVGCVIVREGRIVGRGWTRPGGRPHAETVALAQAGAAASGATAYVTLEPCEHHGRTPPCAEALIAGGVSRVVTALTDPDPRVQGRGHALLRTAGIAVTENVLAGRAAEVNAGFVHRVATGMPTVTQKLALTLDGRIATEGGASRWITGPEARRATHAMRARHDAVMVGIGTVLADDPDLTVRDLGVSHQPVRIVLDSRLRLPPGSQLARSAAESPVWVCHGPDADPDAARVLTDCGVTLLPCAVNGTGRLDLVSMLLALGARGLTRVLCESGGQVAASLLAGSQVAEFVAITAGRVFGAGGTPGVGSLPDAPIAPIPDFILVEARRLGPDLLHRWRRAPVAG